MVALASFSLAVPIEAASQKRSGEDMLAAASASFSSVPFGNQPDRAGLVRRDDEGCITYEECSYFDIQGVEHALDFKGHVAIKVITVSRTDAVYIDALAIGTARTRRDVLTNVRAFLPEAEIQCFEFPDHTSCGATLGDGWVRLTFDRADWLTEARIDAYHFT